MNVGTLVTIAAACALLAGCGDDDRDARPPGAGTAEAEAAVRSVAERFLSAEARGDAATACALITRQSRRALAARVDGDVEAGCARHWDLGAPQGVPAAGIERIYVEREYAEVFMQQEVPDAYVDSLSLAKEGGEWRVMLPEVGDGPA